MSKKGRNKAATALTVVFIFIAAAAALYLMYGEEFYFTGIFGDKKTEASRYAVTSSSEIEAGNASLLTPVLIPNISGNSGGSAFRRTSLTRSRRTRAIRTRRRISATPTSPKHTRKSSPTGRARL